ncbi:MAG: phosphoglycerate dehydrogenase [Deltaproteobacteria bacterium]|nr:phosphoglycerate dehydrogenase [Deltaproteobacteria bacterium]
MKLLIADSLSERGLSILEKESSLEIDQKIGLSAADLKKIIENYDIIAVRSSTRLTQDVLEHAHCLKLIVRAGIGVDNIDLKAATQKGIIVENTPGGNVVTTAEHALALLFAVARHIPQSYHTLLQGQWKRSYFLGTEISGKTLGIIGLGNIGRIVADRAQGLKMNIIGYDPYISSQKAAELEIKLVSLDELLSESDFVTIHVPLLEGTKNLITLNELRKMKKGSFLINCARGGIVKESDLLIALNEGIISGAALDVFEQEPPISNPLVSHPRVVSTPHLGASTEDAQVNVAIEAARQIVEFATNNAIINAVNVPSVKKELLEILQPYINLVEKLGKLVQQLEATFTKIHVEYAGDIVKYDLRPLSSSLLMGFFSQVLGKTVNFVNSPQIAEERGLQLIETKTRTSPDFSSLITVTAHGEKKSHIVSGTIFGKTEPRIVSLDGFHIEAIPSGHILIITNEDQPNVIGSIGNTLGRQNINISRMHLGLDRNHKKAISLINIDTQATDSILKSLEKLPHILNVKQVFL